MVTLRGQQMMDMSTNEVVEEAIIGDYELYVVLDRNLRIYQIGLQRAGQDFTDMEQQARRVVPKQWGAFDRKAFKQAVRRWLDKYHLLLIASHDSARTKLYALVLRALRFVPQRAAEGGIVYITDGTADLAPIRRAEALMEQMRH